MIVLLATSPLAMARLGFLELPASFFRTLSRFRAPASAVARPGAGLLTNPAHCRWLKNSPTFWVTWHAMAMPGIACYQDQVSKAQILSGFLSWIRVNWQKRQLFVPLWLQQVASFDQSQFCDGVALSIWWLWKR